MKKYFCAILLFTLIALNFNCTSSSNRVQGWSLNMRGMAESIEKLIPYLYDSKRYQNPNNEKFISLYLKNLNSYAADLDRHTGKGISGDDPLFAVGLKGLKSRIEKASESYFVENYEYSQKLLQASVHYCNSCHTRTSVGPTFIKWDKFESITENLNPLDYSEVLVATRQFPQAVDLLTEATQAGQLTDTQQEEAVTRLMVISLRNLNSPQQALAILTDLKTNQIPEGFKKDFPQWISYLKQWNAKQLKNKDSVQALLKSNNPTGRHLVEAIHNSLILHQGLSTEVSKPIRSQMYFNLGKIYGQYSDLMQWQLPETYFEACIYQNPGNKQALKCYYALESRLIADPKNTPASLVASEKEKLKKLKVLAQSKNSSPGSSSGGFGGEDL